MRIVVIDGRRFKTTRERPRLPRPQAGSAALLRQNLDALHDILTSRAEETRFRIRYPASIEKHSAPTALVPSCACSATPRERTRA